MVTVSGALVQAQFIRPCLDFEPEHGANTSILSVAVKYRIYLAPVFCLADFGIRIKLGLAKLDFFYSSFFIKTVIAISFVCFTIKTFKPGETVL